VVKKQIAPESILALGCPLSSSPSTPLDNPTLDVLIVGAGVAGLAAAEALKAKAPSLTYRILESAPIPGGRLASRQGDFGILDTTAQFFTARTSELKTLVAHWQSQGWLAPWFEKPDENEKPEIGWCAPIGMGSLMAHWSMRHDVRCGMDVVNLQNHASGWQVDIKPTIFSSPVQLRSRAVLLTPPWPLIRAMVEPHLQGVATQKPILERLASIRYAPCLVLEMEGDPERRPGFNDGCEVRAPGLEFMTQPDVVCIADQSSKKLSGRGMRLIMLMTPEFSETHWQLSDAELLPLLKAKARTWIGDSSPLEMRIGRWPYARVMQSFGDPFLDCGASAPLLIAGDGFAGARVEGAFTSGWHAGVDLASRLL
jgi:renalase